MDPTILDAAGRVSRRMSESRDRKVSMGPFTIMRFPCRPRLPSVRKHACMHDECWEPIVPTSPPCKFPLSFVPRSFSIMLAPTLLPSLISMISHINATTVKYGSWLYHHMDADVGACDEPLLEGGAPIPDDGAGW